MKLNVFYEKYFAILFLVIAFALSTVNFSIPEYGVYSSMTESMIEDGDLNIANQIYFPEQKFLITESKNYPHHHSSGAVAAWLPFALYAKTLANFFDFKEINKETNVNNKFLKAFNIPEGTFKFFLHLTLVFGNIILVCLATNIFLKNKKIFKENRNFVEYTILFLATPLLYYMTIEPATSNNVALLITVGILSFLSKDKIESKHIILLGLLWGIGFTIRVGTFFYLPIILWILRKNLSIKNLTILFSFGALGALPHFINEYLRFGATAFGYSAVFNFNLKLLIETMFSPYKGIFIYSPIFLIALIAGLKNFSPKNVFTLENAIISTILIKLFCFGNTYSHGGGVFGARQFIQDIPLFFILFLNIENLKLRKYLLGFSLFISTYFLVFYLSRSLEIPTDIQFLEYTYRWNEVHNDFWSHKLFLIEKIVNFIVPGIIITLLWQKIKVQHVTLYLTALVFIMTGLNLYNNNSNVKALTENGFYKNARQVKTMHAALAYENIGSLQERIIFLQDQNRKKEALETNKIRNQYVQDIVKNEEFYNSDYLFQYLPELENDTSHIKYINRF